MSITTKISAAAAATITGIAAFFALTLSAGTAAAETDWNSITTGSGNATAGALYECDWNVPAPC
jgi:hypothetical protein